MIYIKLKGKNMVCFDEIELDNLYKQKQFLEILKEMSRQNVTFNDIRNDEQKMLDISSAISQNASKSKEEHEFFSAFYIFLRFYKKDSKVCFELKHTFDFKQTIDTFEDLKKATEEDTLNDFIIKSGNEIKLFQLKRFRDEAKTDQAQRFIKKVLLHYGNNLGETNLLIMLESPKWGSAIEEKFFENINKEINSLKLKSESQILIAYNENNMHSVVVQVYPRLAKSQIPLKINYRSLLSEYEKRQN